MPAKTYQNNKGRVVGQLLNGIFRKKVSKKKHLLIVLNAWGIDTSILDDLEKNGATEIRIKDTDSGTVYATTPEQFRRHGIVKRFDGPQIFLSLDKWSVSSGKQKPLI